MRKTYLICVLLYAFGAYSQNFNRAYQRKGFANASIQLGLKTFKSSWYVCELLGTQAFRVFGWGVRHGYNLGQSGVAGAAKLPSQFRAMKKLVTDDVDIDSVFIRFEVLSSGRKQYFALMTPSSSMTRKRMKSVRLIPLDLLPRKIRNSACYNCLFYVAKLKLGLKCRKFVL